MRDYSPVTDFARLAAAEGWVFHTAWKDRCENPEALAFGGSRFATLTSPDGLVRVALRGELIYYHKGRVWLADVYEPNRVTVAGLVVERSSRRSGVGTAAMKALMAIAREHGVRLMLEAHPIADERHREKRLTAPKLVRWYTRLGFVPAYPREGRTILEYPPQKSEEVERAS